MQLNDHCECRRCMNWKGKGDWDRGEKVQVQALSHSNPLTAGYGTVYIKGTGSQDGLSYCGPEWIDLGLNKGSGWCLNFVGVSPFPYIYFFQLRQTPLRFIKLVTYFSWSLLIACEL